MLLVFNIQVLTTPFHSSEAAISLCSRFRFGEPAAAELFLRDAGEVGFDVKDWCAVEHIDPVDMQVRAFTAAQFDNSHTDWVRTER